MDIVTKVKPRCVYEIPEKTCEYLPVSDLKEWIEGDVRTPVRDFEPCCYYNEDGDMFEVIWKNDSCYSEQCGNFRVMKSFETGEIVGVTIHNVFGKIGLKEIES